MPVKKFYKKTSVVTKKTTTDINTNAKFLIIVESPSKCKKIEGFLGTDYCCIASKGHIRTIEGLKSINMDSFEPAFSIIEEKQEHVEYMRNIIKKFSKQNIILASDDDREGEAIAWHICKVFDLPVETTYRIIFHEITKNAIINAVATPTIINMNLVKAQHARQVLDIIVGYKISPFLWKYLYHNKSNSLSAGRCQTPALRLVYENDKSKGDDIETKYKTMGVFFSKNIRMDLNKEMDKQEEVLEFLEKSKQFKHILSIGSPKEAKKSPPKPFNTSRLLQVASNTLHLSPKHTMDICQKLYQAGYITYMRTDSQKYSNEFIKKVENFVLETYKNKDYIGKNENLENKDINNPHEAIRVTQLETTSISDTDTRVCSLYKLIWRTSIESCMSDARYNAIDIKISAPLSYHYDYRIEIPLFLGWKKLVERSEESLTETQNDPGSLLLYFQSIEKVGKPISYNYIESTIVVRNKHQYYTEATLINKLEDLGIGRPSTFASIVETIQERGYVKRVDIEGEIKKCIEFRLEENLIKKIEKEKTFGNEKNKLVIQSVGILTLEFLVKHFQKLFEYEYTKTMEEHLDFISSGKNNEWSYLCKSCYNEIKELSKPISKLEKQIYKIDDSHDFIFEKYGPVIRIHKEDGTFEFKPAKKDIKIDLEKLKQRGYTVDELYEIKNNNLGKYQEQEIFIKNGKYGPYVEWGEKRESIKNIKKPLDKITIEDIKEFLESNNSSNKNSNILRILNDEFSIRKGKFGAYAYYKTADMNKPQFFNINKFNEGFSTCDANDLIEWLIKTYNL
jgi:DNA topoisomerase-1